MGTPQAAVPSFERLIADGHEIVAVYTQPDRPSGRGNKIAFSPIKETALAKGLEVFQPSKIKTDEAFEIFKSHNADLAIVVAYGRILPDRFLTAFDAGAINVHFSLLPKYRGAAPVNWAIVNGETETGVTTMQMDSGLDTGAVLLQSATEIAANETSVELMTRLSTLGAGLLAQTLENLSDLKPISQEHDRASLAPIMKREDGLIDWGMPAFEIVNRVRGFQPFPTAFTYLEGQKLALWETSAAGRESNSSLLAGQVVSAHGDSFVIYCGDGSLLNVESLQPEGKRRMSVRDFLNGFNVWAGAVMGS